MFTIKQKAVAGTLESSDILVEVAPSEGGVVIELQSIVINQYGEAVEKTIRAVLEQFGADNVTVKANDRGALDYTVRARVETALKRAQGGY